MRITSVFALLLAAVPARAADPSPSVVDKVMADALAAWEVPGAALVVVRGDEVAVLNGYGRKQLDRPDPVTPDTVFPLASCSKAFTSTLLAMLADDGLVGWDDRVRDHLPSFKLSDPHADALVTVRDLLSHRTGLGGNDRLWYHAPWNLDETLRRVEKLPLAYPFRAGFEYTSLTYIAAGRLAARRAGKPWEQLVKERITDPLGMAGVRFTTTDPPADRAVGHHVPKGGTLGPMPAYDMPEPNPAGSVHASARDLGGWLRFHLSGGLAPGGRRLVGERALAETKMPQTIIRLEGNARAMNPDTVQLSYGMGWVVADHRGKRVCAHGGMIDGFRVQVTLLPDEKLGIAALNNRHETRMNQAVTNTLIDLYCDLPGRDWNGFFRKLVADAAAAKRAARDARDAARKPDTKPSLPPDGYVGDYTDPAFGVAKVWAKGGKLFLDWSSFRCPLEHFQDDVFRVADGHLEDEMVEFATAPGRGAVALRLGGVVFKK
ncbi:MAG: serine hydrolase [Gemmataceae bacterium]|nr:serine hydrolase [Gemmataceae bacterium]